MKSKHISLLISILINAVFVIVILLTPSRLNANGIETTYIVGIENWIVLGIQLGLFVLAFKKMELWKYLFLILLLVQLFGILPISRFNIYFGLGVVQVSLLSVVLLAFHLMFNPEIISGIKTSLAPSAKEVAESSRIKQENYDNGVKRFKTKFSKKNKPQLKILIQENELVPEAIAAVKELLLEKEGIKL